MLCREFPLKPLRIRDRIGVVEKYLALFAQVAPDRPASTNGKGWRRGTNATNPSGSSSTLSDGPLPLAISLADDLLVGVDKPVRKQVIGWRTATGRHCPGPLELPLSCSLRTNQQNHRTPEKVFELLMQFARERNLASHTIQRCDHCLPIGRSYSR